MAVADFFSIQNLYKDFGGIQALKNIYLTLQEGIIYGVIGPNGAGKTTLINVITGLERVDKGKILFYGERIDQLPPEQVYQRGISRTFQSGMIVPGLTVLENITIGLTGEKFNKFPKECALKNFFSFLGNRKEITERGERILEKFDLQKQKNRWAEDLIWFERQLVQIARAVASEPRFLLLDEPTAGIGFKEKGIIQEQLKKINQSGVTLLVVSHDIQWIREIAEKIIVLHFGQIISEGLSEHVFKDPRVLEVYLGQE